MAKKKTDEPPPLPGLRRLFDAATKDPSFADRLRLWNTCARAAELARAYPGAFVALGLLPPAGMEAGEDDAGAEPTRLAQGEHHGDPGDES